MNNNNYYSTLLHSTFMVVAFFLPNIADQPVYHCHCANLCGVLYGLSWSFTLSCPVMFVQVKLLQTLELQWMSS